MSLRPPKKILIVTDLHDRRTTLAPLAAALERYRPDAVFCLGDLTEHARQAAEFTEVFLETIRKSEAVLFCISGNNDAPVSLEILRRNGVLIDYEERKLNDTRVIGIGYEPPAEPFNPDLRGSLLLTHLPPKRNSVPDTVIRMPRFHFSGHFHKSERIWRLRETTVVQVPSAMLGRAALLFLPKGHVEFVDLA
jgi:Icc-related predicted phosphoesterase